MAIQSYSKYLFSPSVFTQNIGLYKVIKSPLFIVFIVALCHLGLSWPGALSPDSETQYAMAISGVYTNHHPPLMSFIWRYLDQIYPGPGMMLLLHFCLLYGAVYYLMKCFANSRLRFLFLLLPVCPHILICSHMIWKDVGFAFSFLLFSSYLAYLTYQAKKPSNYQLCILTVILLYGTSVKFQAQYCAPILLAWLVYAFLNYQFHLKKFIAFFSLFMVLFYLALNNINTLLIKNVHNQHSWQYVKLYDLAAISYELQTPFFPEFSKNSNFGMNILNKRFNREKVDDLVFRDPILGDPILRIGTSEQERNEIYITWLKTITQHPIFYLKHRLMNLGRLLFYPLGFLRQIKPVIENIFSFSFLLSFTISTIIQITMSHFLPVILSISYFIYGLFSIRSSWAAIPLISFNATGITMVLVLFFCSMAGTPRYTYITICMLHASHGFAYLCYRSRKRDQLPRNLRSC